MRLRHSICFLLPLLIAGCENAISFDGRCLPEQARGPVQRWATQQLTLKGAPGINIDGGADGQRKNALARVFDVVMFRLYNLVNRFDEASAAGQMVLLLETQGQPEGGSGCGRITLHQAAGVNEGGPAPRFDGQNRFSILSGQVSADLTGAAVGTAIDTTAPINLTGDDVPRFVLKVPLLFSALELPLYGVHVQVSPNGNSVEGQLHGVVRRTDVDRLFLPVLTREVNAVIKKYPNENDINSLVRYFEKTGDTDGLQESRDKCQVAADCCAKPENRLTCRILPVEVEKNAAIQLLLTPDVRAFPDGSFRLVPDSDRDERDALSFGVSLSAVSAEIGGDRCPRGDACRDLALPAEAKATDWYGVWGATPDDIWIVGDNGAVLRWDGFRWSRPASGTTEHLRGVWGSAANDVWIVGEGSTVLHWDGAALARVAAPTGGVALCSVWGSGAGNLWMVGQRTIWHRQGDFSPVSPPADTTGEELRAVFGAGPQAIWVLGKDGRILHFDGSRWEQQKPTNNELHAGWASGPADAWAVGQAATVLHWDGTSWSLDGEGPAQEQANYFGAFGTGPGDVWIAGTVGRLFHWDGRAWSRIGTSQVPGGTALRAVHGLGLGPDHLWTVGTGGLALHRRAD